MELKIDSEKVLDTISKYPESKDILNNLFPELKKENEPFIKLGDIFLRKGHKNFYTIFNKNGIFSIRNLTQSNNWERQVGSIELFGTNNIENGRILTRSQFKKLTTIDINEFTVVTYNDVVEGLHLLNSFRNNI